MDSSSKVAQFHLGMSEDGQRCLMVFIDEKQHAMECVADFSEFTAFISSLCDAANEMVKRQGTDNEPVANQAAAGETQTIQCRPIDVSSAAFQVHPGDGSIMGALVSDAGEVVGVRMRPQVASQLMRDLLLASPAART
ncbi:MAG: hypothetical protein KF889_01205 [Alphaproteobacteria bacterium]|nr:hypothetical protein [Alphaproteobacteria bacterium]MCW5741521.1 hypothetical protein [Alphaproteobacteria bacterium]